MSQLNSDASRRRMRASNLAVILLSGVAATALVHGAAFAAEAAKSDDASAPKVEAYGRSIPSLVKATALIVAGRRSCSGGVQGVGDFRRRDR